MAKKDKIDTQGMSGAGIKTGMLFTKTTKYDHDPVTGDIIWPSFVPLHDSKMLDGDLRDELKELIHEVLDERQEKTRNF